MKIQKLRTNHLENPLGYCLDHLFLSWEVTDTKAKTDRFTRIQVSEDENFKSICHDTGEMEYYGKPFYNASFVTKPCTRYFWRVMIVADNSEEAACETAWFETPFSKGVWPAKWISPASETDAMPCIYKSFSINKNIKRARLYCYGVGLYEAYLDDKKIGDEFLSPGYHSYDLLNEYQTFDVTDMIHTGENKLSFILGEGWYKGRFVFEDGYKNVYGDRKLLTAVLIIENEDGEQDILCTDKTWRGVETEIQGNSIYDGEIIDRDRKKNTVSIEEAEGFSERLMPRMNAPLRKVETINVKEIIKTPSGETVLDFGEAVTGWVEVFANGKMGFLLQYGEWMQNGEFYRENLRTAAAEFSFNGTANNEWIRPHFTYYGFRYVLVKGIQDIKKENIIAYRLMSDMDAAGTIKTSNEKVNQLFENTLRSQKCNFLDIPTDCPQRDERMGWTGDIAIFARTASFHMHTAAFLHHYMINLQQEQRQLKGSVPFFVPTPKPAVHEGINPFLITSGACTWGDAATIIPWELYLHYRDKNMLAMHYPVMCSWVNYINERAKENKNPKLWQNDRQLGDWLALDNGNLDNPIGLTDTGFIASAYYYYSTTLCAKAAKVLSQTADENRWTKQAEEIRQAFFEEYFDADGELLIEKTQTAYAIALYMGLYEQKKKKVLVDGLRKDLEEHDHHLTTGFVGTGMLMQALSENGLAEEAYTLLLQEDYPSWLREVNLGATSVWERWNSVDDNKIITSTGMNSLNHYAYGCVAGWMYETMCGFRWDEAGRFYIKLTPDYRFTWIEGSCHTAYGEVWTGWCYEKNGQLKIAVRIPFQAQVIVELPWGECRVLKTGSYHFEE